MKILGLASVVLCVCSILCGLWMKFGPETKDVNFHAMLVLATLVVCLITIVMFLIKAR